ncbi:MAG: RNA polymerase sigma factor [Gaiellaceae bacterium]
MGASTRQIEQVYRRRFAQFVGAATGILGSADDAVDVVQEAFAQALAKRREFRSDGPVEAWVWAIVLHKAFDRLRVAVPIGSLDEIPELGLPDAERDPELAAALRALAPRQRLIVYLYYLADLPYSSIAEVCAVSEGTVAATLAQARAALAASLAETPLCVTRISQGGRR